jgi:hypothetical protein
VGFLDRLKRDVGAASTIADSEWYALHGSFMSHASVVGESNYQSCISKTLRHAGNEPPFPLDKWPPERPERLPWFAAYLRHEPDNKYDANAICVSTRFGVVGYLERHRAESYVPLLKLLESHGYRGAACCAYGLEADNGMWGVVLKLSNARKCIGHVKADMSFRSE